MLLLRMPPGRNVRLRGVEGAAYVERRCNKLYCITEVSVCLHSPAAAVVALMNAVGPAPAVVLALTPIV